KELLLGRSPDCDIMIDNDPQISNSHCTLELMNNRILVQDKKSKNGPRVNGIPIQGYIHAESDSIIGIGRTELRLTLVNEVQ
ncbi:FHA domain-containing protein, partial [Azospirillum sp. B4]|uniref:FHA domain-containing protein n=1 Tax=Azospirillum sp. B4 TaxID=95605 RepID=UPI0011DDFF89